MTDEELRDVHPGRQGLGVGLAIGITIPGILLRLYHPDVPHPIEALVFGLAIIGAAFVLSWAAEVAQLDISAGLAIAVLAFIAVLPEYAVDFVLAFNGGQDFAEFGRDCQPPGDPGESACSLALANMTGANRLLIGIGWSLVVFVAYYRSRRGPRRMTEVQLERSHAVEVTFLGIATMYSLTLPLKESITPVDAAILVTLFVAYTIRVSRAPAEEPHLVGPARLVGTFRTPQRRLSVILMFIFAATVILLVAEVFAEALVDTGREFGVSEFLLIQWLAPLASEAPELLVAGLYAWRLNTNAGLGTLVSSKVNQWTLLVGTLPIVFSIAAEVCTACRSTRTSARSCCSQRHSRSSRSRFCSRCRSRRARPSCCSRCSGLSSSSGRWCPSRSSSPSASASPPSTSCWDWRSSRGTAT